MTKRNSRFTVTGLAFSHSLLLNEGALGKKARNASGTEGSGSVLFLVVPTESTFASSSPASPKFLKAPLVKTPPRIKLKARFQDQSHCA